ncbi:hypothetical protein [Halostella sp. PRR32]|uniref:hypothetical protein n=1 Tax=Halostella sp. PRR32 TaxID=3098147 RepID=UPI002B1D0595|nr:hypothetical protein [Halostella sp. PRR32]
MSDGLRARGPDDATAPGLATRYATGGHIARRPLDTDGNARRVRDIPREPDVSTDRTRARLASVGRREGDSRVASGPWTWATRSFAFPGGRSR